MKELSNQVIYQCEYCNKRFVTKRGAKLHEEKYCWKSPIPKEHKKREIMDCDHRFETVYTYISGEAVQEPSHDECVKCGIEKTKFERMKKEAEQ